MKKALAILFASLTILTQTSFAFETSEFESIPPVPTDIVEAADEKYNYPVLPGTDEWIALENTRTRHDACEVPEEILEKLTTKALLLTALDYPFNTDISAFDDAQYGFDYIVKHSNAWSTLICREDIEETVFSLLDSGDFDNDQIIYIELLLNHSSVYPLLSNEAKAFLTNIETMGLYNPPEGAYLVSETVKSKTIYTPKENRPVTMSTWRYEWLTETADKKDKDYIRDYPSAYYIGRSTMKYNCFSYAFYLQRTSNNYVMANQVSRFWEDGSYVRVSSPKVGDIALYWDNDLDAYKHAGIVTIVKPEIWVGSKWGQGPLMDHAVMDCPYKHMTVHYYRLYTEL